MEINEPDWCKLALCNIGSFGNYLAMFSLSDVALNLTGYLQPLNILVSLTIWMMIELVLRSYDRLSEHVSSQHMRSGCAASHDGVHSETIHAPSKRVFTIPAHPIIRLFSASETPSDAEPLAQLDLEFLAPIPEYYGHNLTVEIS